MPMPAGHNEACIDACATDPDCSESFLNGTACAFIWVVIPVYGFLSDPDIISYKRDAACSPSLSSSSVVVPSISSSATASISSIVSSTLSTSSLATIPTASSASTIQGLCSSGSGTGTCISGFKVTCGGYFQGHSNGTPFLSLALGQNEECLNACAIDNDCQESFLNGTACAFVATVIPSYGFLASPDIASYKRDPTCQLPDSS